MSKCATVTVEPKGTPNLTVTDIVPNKETVTVGESITFEITYKNTGDLEGGTDKMIDITGAISDKLPCSSLAPNESDTASISLTPQSSGTLELCAEIVPASL